MRPVRANARGFTLIEMMVVIGVAGILVGLASVGMRQMSLRATVGSAANELLTAINLAKARAIATSSDVWFIVYSEYGSSVTLTDEIPGADGMYFVIEDRDSNFGRPGGGYENFDPADPEVTAPDRLHMQLRFTSNYPTSGGAFSRVAFGVLPGPKDLPAPGPASLNGSTMDKGCSFCTSHVSGGKRGAIVFKGDGSARIVDGDGDEVVLNMGRLGIRGGKASNNDYRIAISGPTGLVKMY